MKRNERKKENIKSLIKTLLLIFLYIFNLNIVSSLFSFLKIDEYNMSFLSDAIYFAIVIIVYRNTLLDSVKDIENKTGKKLVYTLLGFVAILFINLLFNFIPNFKYNSISPLYGKFYIVFKMLLFSCVAEELLFKQTIRELVDKNYLFVIISSFIYAFASIIYSDLSLTSTFIMFFWCFSIEAVLSIFYIKSDNIVVPMISKFLYNLIKVVGMLLGA